MANSPWFIKNISNTWTVSTSNPSERVVRIEPEININILLGLLMKLFMPLLLKLGTNTIEELKYYIENEKPHPRKLKVLEKLQKKK